jgi:hypothetical protein
MSEALKKVLWGSEPVVVDPAEYAEILWPGKGFTLPARDVTAEPRR